MRALLLVPLALVAACMPETVDDDLATSSSELVIGAIPRRSAWKYWDRGGDLGTAWRGTYDDAAWASGAGPLGYGETYLSTTVSYGPSSSNKFITTYFRHTFVVDDPAALVGMRGEIMFDDGVVVYLNGTRIGSASMPAGTTTASTLALGHEANNTYNVYDWTSHLGLLVGGTNVIAFEVHQTDPTSSDLVFDASLELTTATLDHNIPKQSDWRFWDRGGDLGTAWAAPGFDDAAWGHGNGILGYGESYIRTPLGFGPDASHKYMTTYFRKQFLVDDPDAVNGLDTQLLYDDGLVVYLNGVKLYGVNMPQSGVTASTPASTSHEAGLYENWIFNDQPLVTGVNTLAVEAHQIDPSSSDLVFDMAVTLENQPPPPPEDIPAHSEWRYWDKGGDKGTAWRVPDPSYFIGDWGTGRGVLGYGETYVNTTISFGPNASDKFITSYFRRTFHVDDPSVITAMRGDLMYDDGAVVYINGHEVQRLAMPTGTITAATRSSGHELNNAYETFDWSAAIPFLVAGDNLIAVEVHQASSSSSDLTFDAALHLDSSTTCPVTGLTRRAYATGAGLNDVWVGPNGVVWAVGHDGMVGRRADAEGGAWCWVTPVGANRWIDGVWGTDEHNVWMVGEGIYPGPGLVVQFDGQRFIEHDIGTPTFVRGVWGTGPNDVWIVGQLGVIRHWNGATWENKDLPSTDIHINRIWGASATQIWALADHNNVPGHGVVTTEVYKYNPSTGRFALEASFFSADRSWYSIGLDGSSASDIWITGRADGTPGGFAARYNGTQWSMVSIPSEIRQGRGDTLFDPVVDPPGQTDGVWIAGNFGSAIRFDGATWTQNFPDTTYMLAMDARGSSMWAVGQGGRAWVWTPASGWILQRSDVAP